MRVGALPSAICGHEPTHAVHVQPFADRRVFLWLRAAAKDVAVGILDLHFVGPGIVRGQMADFRAGAAILFEERVGVAHPNPDPAASVSLIALGEEDRAAAAGDTGEVGSLPIEFEAELLDVVEDAGVEVLDAEDRSGAFE